MSGILPEDVRIIAVHPVGDSSAAALLRAMAEGGNCELGLLTELDASRRPPVGRPLGAELASHPYQLPPPPAAETAPVLLGAALEPGGLRILRGGSAGYWDESQAWAPVVARATTAIVDPGVIRDEERATAARLAAVALAALRSQVPRFSVQDPLHILYE